MNDILITTVLFMTTLSNVAFSDSISIHVKNIKLNKGKIGCALYNQPQGFPGNGTNVAQQWLDADTSGVVCRFENLVPDSYAVAVMHDLNNNQRMDKYVLGIPQEDWGVTNNVRPSMRAPRFDEARFELTDPITLEIELNH